MTVVTANGEVPTNEEAQVYVHDLDLFVKVQILNHTPTVLPHGKLCKEPGYSKQRKKKVCTENFLPLVVPDIAGLVIVKSSRRAT